MLQSLCVARRILRLGCLVCAAVCIARPSAANGIDNTLNLQACFEETRVVYGDMGSVSLRVIGPVGDTCEIAVEAEVETPRGAPRTICRIPRALGALALDLVPGTPFLAPMAEFCTSE